jgi:hypothetical protein
MRRSLVFTLILALFSLIVTARCTPQATGNTLLRFGKTEGVIFSKEAAIEWADLLGDEYDDFWVPSTEDVQTLEAALPEYLRLQVDRFHHRPTSAKQLDQYRRQYIGLLKGGKRIILANFFCNDGGTQWKEDYVFVMDGGDCYFRVRYDLDGRQFLNLEVNGEG